jgi:hypothetical protein
MLRKTSVTIVERTMYGSVSGVRCTGADLAACPNLNIERIRKLFTFFLLTTKSLFTRAKSEVAFPALMRFSFQARE